MNQEPSVTFPLRVGAIDAGSNAIRFVVADFQDPLNYTLISKTRVPVRLGHLVFTKGGLDDETIEKAATAFRLFKAGLDLMDVRHFRAVATSATREASNRHAFLSKIKEESGIDLEPISGAEEARLVHMAVRTRVNLSKGRWILVDLGGGSVEVSLVDDTGILWSESYQIGTVRLLETLEAAEGRHDSVREWVDGKLRALTIPPPESYSGPTGFAATGGNIEAIAQLASARMKEGVAFLTTRSLDKMVGKLAALTTEERISQLGLRPDRADVILPAALVYQHFTRLAKTNRVVVPNVGVKDGVLLDLVNDLMGQSPPRREG